MRKAQINLNVSQHWRAKGQPYGAKIEIGTKDLPMSLLHSIRNLPLQWKVFWAGPRSPQAPVLRVLWGWGAADAWTPGYAYVRHEVGGATRVKFTLSRTAIRTYTDQDLIPLGKWHGDLTCEPDEEAPLQIALRVSPLVYVVRSGILRSAPATIDPSLPLPRVVIP